jgi:hypothetical protein
MFGRGRAILVQKMRRAQTSATITKKQRFRAELIEFDDRVSQNLQVIGIARRYSPAQATEFAWSAPIFWTPVL